jgi:hypothetical protein
MSLGARKPFPNTNLGTIVNAAAATPAFLMNFRREAFSLLLGDCFFDDIDRKKFGETFIR